MGFYQINANSKFLTCHLSFHYPNKYSSCNAESTHVDLSMFSGTQTFDPQGYVLTPLWRKKMINVFVFLTTFDLSVSCSISRLKDERSGTRILAACRQKSYCELSDQVCFLVYKFLLAQVFHINFPSASEHTATEANFRVFHQRTSSISSHPTSSQFCLDLRHQ